MVLYMKDSTMRFLQLINTFRKVGGYKINRQKCVQRSEILQRRSGKQSFYHVLILVGGGGEGH